MKPRTIADESGRAMGMSAWLKLAAPALLRSLGSIWRLSRSLGYPL